MNLPHEVPVMILPNVTLFPQAMLPLYIFEPRYRRMLADSLAGNRLFAMAMQKPGSKRETASPVAGLGVIRVSVEHSDGSSHLILQGMTRVELVEAVRYKPYRIHRVKHLTSPPCDNVTVDALLNKVRELLVERIEMGLPFPFPVLTSPHGKTKQEPPNVSPREILRFLEGIQDPAQVADLVSCATLPDGEERQAIMEAVDVETRLRRLIGYLLVEIARKGRNK
jgi:Lon protease-like protein